ncbi:MAG: DEAD/DEAH box helicase [Prolixibacteraceae bacterium]|jgi:ATP-dependent RNA helicase DeaD|nr:DEAD/DEAH box helicase [Prolixibacteraceae bacterium]MDD4756012.1 DEAD/DEAH box helicase [Prolixibacteraceae bacterium]
MILFNEMGLNADILKAVEELGFENPTPIQEKTIPFLLQSQNDMTAVAQTGTGKTAAFGLPIIQQIDKNDKSIQALILSPTRELAMQIAADLNSFSKFSTKTKIAVVYGGSDISKQIRQLDEGAGIVVGTPGRTLDLIKRKKLKIGKIKWLVLDEADEMLSMGFKDDLDAILENAPAEKQTLLFSATMPQEIVSISKRYMTGTYEISAGRKNTGADNVEHHYYLIHAKDRYIALKRVVDSNPSIYGIIFCRTRSETKEVADKLMQDGYNADALHGDLSQAQRDFVMSRFRARHLQILVATDVAARGLDVNDLTHVINYNLPDDPEIYIHRSGRTGRAGKKGISIVFIHLREKSKLRQAEKKVNKEFIRKNVPSGKEICEKQLFSLIDKVENVSVNEIQIAEFMPVIYKKLAWLEREELIKHFVSVEFNRFLQYYNNAPDINVDESSTVNTEVRNSRNGKRKKEKSSYNGRVKTDIYFSRFFFNQGKKNGINKRKIIDLVNHYLPNKSAEIGDIEVMKNFSFFEVDKRYEKEILNSVRRSGYKGNNVEIDIARSR